MGDLKSPAMLDSAPSSPTMDTYQRVPASPAYPPVQALPSPQLYMGESRIRRFTRKLAFWRKRPATAADVHAALSAAVKSHDKYRQNAQHAYDTMVDWAECLAPQCRIQRDYLQLELTDEEMSNWLVGILGAMRPVLDLQARQASAMAAFSHSFVIMKDEEASCRDILKSLSSAERRYFKSLAADRSVEERIALDRERHMLLTQLDEATARFHKSGRLELPKRFQQLIYVLQSIEEMLGPIHQSMMAQLPSEVEATRFHNDTRSRQMSSFYTEDRYPVTPLITSPLVAPRYSETYRFSRDSDMNDAPELETPADTPQSSSVGNVKVDVAKIDVADPMNELSGLNVEEFRWS